MPKRKPLYMSNVAIEGSDSEGNRFTDREVSDKPFMGQGSEYFGSNASGAEAGRGRVNPARVDPSAPAPKNRRSAAVEQAIQEVDDMKMLEKIRKLGFKAGGSVGSASKRADGCAQRGKTKGRMI